LSHPAIDPENLFNFYDLDGNERSFDISQPAKKKHVWFPSEKSGRLDEMLVGLDGGRWVLMYNPPDLAEDPSTLVTPPHREVTAEEACYWIMNVSSSELPPELLLFAPRSTDTNYFRLQRDWHPTSHSRGELPAATPECPKDLVRKALPDGEKSTREADRDKSPVLPPKPGIDFDAVAEALLRKNAVLASKLVKFMASRTTATFQDVIDKVHGEDREEGTVRTLVTRTNNALHSLESRLKFKTRDCQVIRHIDPE